MRCAEPAEVERQLNGEDPEPAAGGSRRNQPAAGSGDRCPPPGAVRSPVEMEMSSGDDAEQIENEHDVDLPMPSQEGSGLTSAQMMGLWVLIIAVSTVISYAVCPPGQTFCAALPAKTKSFEQEFTMPGFHVTSQQTTYECHGFDFPQVPTPDQT